MILLTNNEGWAGATACAQLLEQGADGMDAIEAGVRLVEAEPSIRTVGRGGKPNLLGEVELDAAVMEGNNLRTGAVGALKGFLHPVSVARRVMQDLPHVLLVGEGAKRFAHEIDAQKDGLLTRESNREWQEWVQSNVAITEQETWRSKPLAALCRSAADPEIERGTTVFLARDQSGKLSGATSTSGWDLKYPGRLGDSPVIGAGLYVDSRYGAAACTGAGEFTIRCGTARMVVAALQYGASVEQAVQRAASELAAIAGQARVTIHAIGACGDWAASAINGRQRHGWLWTTGMPEAQKFAIEEFESVI